MEDTAVASAAEQVRAHGEALVTKLRAERPILSLDDLAQMISPNVQLEARFNLTDGSLFLFTVSGLLRGTKLHGALLGGDAMLVRATTEAAAKELAKSGLHSTLELARKHYEQQRLIAGTQDVISTGEPLTADFLLTPRAREQREMLAKMIAEDMAKKKAANH